MADLTAQVIDTSMAFDAKAKDESGNPLPLGTIQIQYGHRRGLKNTRFAIPLNSICVIKIGNISFSFIIVFKLSNLFLNWNISATFSLLINVETGVDVL